MEELDLLKFLRKLGGATVYDVMAEFGIKRTAALYHLSDLIKQKLVIRHKKKREWEYLLADSLAIRQHIEQKIAMLQRSLEHLSTAIRPSSRREKAKAGQKLVLSFPNYYDLQPSDRIELGKHYEIVDYTDTQLYVSPEEFVKRTRDADVIVNNFAGQFTEEIAAQLPRLQYMHVSTTMFWYVDTEALKKRNIHLSNVPYTYRSIAIAEFVLAQTFALLRETVDAAAQARTGVNEFRYFRGEQLRGKKIIIFGTEAGTKDIVELLRGLGVEIGVYTEDSRVDPAEFGLSHFATQEEVFETGDIFYFSWTGGDEVNSLVGRLDREFLDQIKRPVYIISVYRHRFIDYQRIRELMYEGLIRGIALDYYPEIQRGQLNDAKLLLHLPNVIFTPDIAWYTQDSVGNLNNLTTQRLVAYAQGNTEFLLF